MHQSVGITPVLRIQLNRFVIKPITGGGQFFKNSFLIKSIPHALLFVNLQISFDISLTVKSTFKSSFIELLSTCGATSAVDSCIFFFWGGGGGGCPEPCYTGLALPNTS